MMTKKFKNILLVGPLPPPLHGQALAFFEIVNRYSVQSSDLYVRIINTNSQTSPLMGRFLSKVIINIIIIIKLFWFLIILNKIDVIYFTCSRSFGGSMKDIILLLLARIKKIKVINHLHGADFDQFYYKQVVLYRILLDFCYSQINTCIVLLEEMKSQMRMYPHIKCVVISNAYSKDFDLQLLSVDPVNNTSLTFVYLSNIMKTKGILELIEAFKQLVLRHENIRLLIAGDFLGDSEMSRIEIKKEFEKKTYGNYSIQYLGIVKGIQKINLLEKSDVFVLPSYYQSEAFPISIIEAQRAGNAIITTDHNLLKYIIKDQHGRIVQKKDEFSLVRAMEYFINNKDELNSIKKNNMLYAKENYSPENFIKKVSYLIEA